MIANKDMPKQNSIMQQNKTMQRTGPRGRVQHVRI